MGKNSEIFEDWLADYAKRKKMTVEEAREEVIAYRKRLFEYCRHAGGKTTSTVQSRGWKSAGEGKSEPSEATRAERTSQGGSFKLWNQPSQLFMCL